MSRYIKVVAAIICPPLAVAAVSLIVLFLQPDDETYPDGTAFLANASNFLQWAKATAQDSAVWPVATALAAVYATIIVRAVKAMPTSTGFEVRLKARSETITERQSQQRP